MGERHYGPPEAFGAPRYTGIRTFARAPYTTDWANADLAVIGVPFDTATSYRTGPRFGPSAIRDQSQLLRPWHTQHQIDVFGLLSLIDGGDLNVTPGNAEKTTEQIAEGLAPVIAGGAVPLVLGGDHSIVLGELRAHARAHGPVGVVLLDAHADTWDQYYGERARERLGDGPAYLSFDIDVLDPAFAPGTGTPEVAGLLPHEALAFLRALAGIAFVGYDVVEVSPQFDGPGQVTSLNAASVAYELLALTAAAR